MALARTARGVERTATEREGARRAIIFNANGKVKCRMNEGGEGQSDGGAWSLRRRTSLLASPRALWSSPDTQHADR